MPVEKKQRGGIGSNQFQKRGISKLDNPDLYVPIEGPHGVDAGAADLLFVRALRVLSSEILDYPAAKQIMQIILDYWDYVDRSGHTPHLDAAGQINKFASLHTEWLQRMDEEGLVSQYHHYTLLSALVGTSSLFHLLRIDDTGTWVPADDRRHAPREEQSFPDSIKERYSMVTNPRCTARKLSQLAEDPELLPEVLRHPNCPLELILSAADGEDLDLIYAVLTNPTCPVSILEKFAVSKDPQTRLAVAQHPYTPKKQLETLRRDPSSTVRIAAGVDR